MILIKFPHGRIHTLTHARTHVCTHARTHTQSTSSKGNTSPKKPYQFNELSIKNITAAMSAIAVEPLGTCSPRQQVPGCSSAWQRSCRGHPGYRQTQSDSSWSLHCYIPPANPALKGKGSFYIVRYPVRWTAQSALNTLHLLTDLFIPTPTRLLWEAF